jgi:hypothetical protein
MRAKFQLSSINSDVFLHFNRNMRFLASQCRNSGVREIEFQHLGSDCTLSMGWTNKMLHRTSRIAAGHPHTSFERIKSQWRLHTPAKTSDESIRFHPVAERIKQCAGKSSAHCFYILTITRQGVGRCHRHLSSGRNSLLRATLSRPFIFIYIQVGTFVARLTTLRAERGINLASKVCWHRSESY